MKVTIMMRLCFLFTVVVLSACRPENSDSISAYKFEQYNLFTWKAGSGDFCFAIMIQAESHKFLRSWTAKRDAKCGTSELKKALIALPKDSYVSWEDWPPGKFDYPADNVVQEIIEFARSKGIHLTQSPALR
jgi:hypothetical protein